MKKLLSVLMAMALVFSCAAFGVQAEEPADSKPGEMYVPAVSFDSFEEGFQLGGLDDEGMDGEQKYMDCGQTVGIFFDVVASTKRAFHGMGLNFSSINGGEGVYVGMKFSLNQSADKRTNFEGATDFVCYVDMKGWGTKRGVRPVISVNGLDANGEPTDVSNTYYPGTGEDKPAYMQDENKNWVRVEDVENGTLGVPQDYCGFIRVPISSFIQPEWDGEDVNGKLDLKEVYSVSVELGCYAANDGNTIAVDEVGFLGDFEDGIPASFLKDGKIPSEEASKNEDGKSEEKSEGAQAGGISGTTILIIVCCAVVVIAAVVIAVVLAGSKKKKASAEDQTETPAEDKKED